MGKRKAKELGHGSIAAATRKSGRRKASTAPEIRVTPPKEHADPNYAGEDRRDEAVDGIEPAKAGRLVSKTRRLPHVKQVDTDEAAPSAVDPTASQTQQYWLMKAEPDTRLERGHDIKFSIDDLAGKTDPEPWDGIRSFPARSNLRAMKRGDLAFFYHSNCKVPAIVGIMEVVREHSPDLSAQDPSAPYFDSKDADSTNPKWSLVHVEFRRKFKVPVTLKELKELADAGGPLKNMQMLKQTRLSVSRVTQDEWDFLVGFVDQRDAEKVSEEE